MFDAQQYFPLKCDVCRSMFTFTIFSLDKAMPPKNAMCETCIEEKSQLILNNIEDYFMQWKVKYPVFQKTRLLDDTSFSVCYDFITSQENRIPYIWAEYFLGVRSHNFHDKAVQKLSPRMINSCQAECLIDFINTHIPKDAQYKFIHSFAACILHPYSVRKPHHILRYYTSEEAYKKETFFKLWYCKFDHLYNCLMEHNRDPFCFGICRVCSMGVKRQSIIVCENCQTLCHYDCFLKVSKTDLDCIAKPSKCKYIGLYLSDDYYDVD
jgi:hypothetical protein